MTGDDELLLEPCAVCEQPTDDYYCAACIAERDQHPVWLAIQRVERGEVTVERVDEPDGTAWGNFELRTSDGWTFEIFPDGVPFEDWDYIDAVTGPDGTRWETDCQPPDPTPPHMMPSSVWLYRPGDAFAARWNMRIGLVRRMLGGLQ